MHKLILKLSVITLIVIASSGTSITLAQSFFDSSPSSTQPNTPKKPMSADEFKNAVNKMGQETKSSITQQANQQFMKQQPQGFSSSATPTPTAPPPEAAPNTTAAPTTAMPPSSQYAPNTTINPTAPTAAAPAARPPSYGTPAAAPTQSQPYTGFGTGNTNPKNTSSPNPSSNNSGGWNIKY